MFWRRRKLPEEEEPLIPRGMIWQATADDISEELPSVMQENSPNDALRIPAKPVQAAQDPLTAQTLGKPLADVPDPPRPLTPPRGWPRVDEAEVARRSRSIDTAVSFPHRKPLLGSVVPNAFDDEREPITLRVPPRPSLVVTAPRAPLREWEDSASAGLQTDVQKDVQADSAPSAGASAHWHPQQAGSAAGPSLLARLRSRTGKGAAFATKGASAATARLEEWRQASNRAIAAAGSRLQDSSQRVRELKVTVRIPAASLRLVTGLGGHAQAVRARTQTAMRSHDKLWMSMAMAALSVLLALGVVAELRRYDPAYPAAASETAHATGASQSIRPASVPLKAAGSPPAKQKPSPTVAGPVGRAGNPAQAPLIAASGKPAIAPAVAPRAKPRIRRSSKEDDYVAADTYVRYGSNGKRTR